MAKKAYVYDGSAWVEITSQPSVPTATTGNLGLTQLTDSVSSTSTSTAATPNSVKTAYDLAVSKASVGSSTPTTIASASVVGTSSEASRADHVHEGVTSITGTSNQVIASASDGPVTLSLPQSIGTTSTPTFGALTVNGMVTGSTASGNTNLHRGVILTRSTAFTIATTTITAAATTANTTQITWTSANKADTGMWASGGTVNLPLIGAYLVTGQMCFGTGTAYSAQLSLFQANTLITQAEMVAGSTNSADTIGLSAIIYSTTGTDNCQLRIAASAASKTITVTANPPLFSVVYLGAW